MRALAIIPARGGSVRLPDKNLQGINGVSLVAMAVQQAMAAGLTSVVVSTDRSQIAIEAARYGAWVLSRPARLAMADTPMIQVLRHAADEAEAGRIGPAGPFDVTVLLQPTSPMRTVGDIAACLVLQHETQADSVVSVVAGADDTMFQMRHARRLEKVPDVVVPNGAVYVLTTAALAAGHDWYSGMAYAYPMPKDRSIDVDTAFDLACARMAMEPARV